MRVLAVLLVAFAALSLLPRLSAVAAAAEKVSYKPPVDGPIVDPYRPPPEPWLAGNRGIDYAPGRGTPVKAAADGEVTFAGQVGGELHVVILHADGVRTSYSFLESIAVHRGDKVKQGQVVGTAGDDLHFGARVGDDYIDPRTLFDDEPQVFLVPDDVRKPGTEAEERSSLSRFLSGFKRVVGAGAGAIGAGASAVGSAVADRIDQMQGLREAASRLNVWPHAVGLISTVVDWWKQRSDCTPASVEPPKVPEPRIAVLVAGLGSNSVKDSLDAVDPKDLGYVDSLRFSYNGGTTAQNAYDSHDTTVDLRTEAERLRELLEQVHRDHPGVPVDIIGHSQGGVIARTMLAYEYDAEDQRLPKVENLVTLASPHQGTDVATALSNLSHTTSGNLAQWAVSDLNVTPVDLRGASVRQLAEHSDFLRDLNNRRLPDGIRFTSIGSRGDLLVPGIHTRAPGATNVLVDPTGLWKDHSTLPGSPEGRREVALAVAGMGPTCQALTNMLADTAVSDAIATTEDAAGLAAFLGANWADGVRL